MKICDFRGPKGVERKSTFEVIFDEKCAENDVSGKVARPLEGLLGHFCMIFDPIFAPALKSKKFRNFGIFAKLGRKAKNMVNFKNFY